MSFFQYREIEPGEFIVVGGDTAAGGDDENFWHFYSKTRGDIPLVFHKQGVAALYTNYLHQAVETIYDRTGVPLVVGLERNNGGFNEMVRLIEWNTKHKYEIFYMPILGKEKEEKSDKPGFETNSLSRPQGLNDLSSFVNSRKLVIYDEVTIHQLKVFILNKAGKPEAAPNEHDDGVMGLMVTMQIAMRAVQPTDPFAEIETPAWAQGRPISAPTWRKS